MKSLTKPSALTAVCFALGILCTCTQQWLFTAGTDAKGMLETGHPGGVISLLLLCICAAVLILGLTAKDGCCFRKSRLSAIGFFISVIGFVYASRFFLTSDKQLLHLIAGVTGIISALCAVVIGLNHWQNRNCATLFYCPSAVFFMFYSVCRYQLWSGESETLRLLFPLLAALGLTLTSYYRASVLETGKSQKAYLLCSRATIFCCLAAIPGNEFGLLYGTMAVSILLDGFALEKPEA